MMRTFEIGAPNDSPDTRSKPFKDVIIKDSGDRKHFSTGAVRDMSEGKGSFHLIPIVPLFDLAKHYEAGQKKYPPDKDIKFPSPDDENWRKGMDLCSLFNSALRHTYKAFLGLDDEDHISSAVWNLFNAKETLRLIKAGKYSGDLDNRPITVELDDVSSKIELEIYGS
jgi:hypothetical protein